MSDIKRSKLFFAAALLVCAAIAAGFWANLQFREQHANIEAARELLALTLPDPAGDPHKLSDWQGKILVVNFWASWCPPCREEMPAFSRLQVQYAAKGVQFVGIAFDTHDAVQAFSKQTPVSYPLLIGGGPERDLMKRLGNTSTALPFTVILNTEGRPVQARLGRYSEADLETRLLAILHR